MPGRLNAWLRSLRRWTQAPNIYLRTIDDSGRPMDAATLDMTEGVIRQTASLWTGGRFGVGIVERGTDTRQSVAGWITVVWISSPEYGEILRARRGRRQRWGARAVRQGQLSVRWRTADRTGCRST